MLEEAVLEESEECGENNWLKDIDSERMLR